MGGVARRATALNDLRKSHPLYPMLVVETGNALKQSEDLENPLNRWIVSALSELGTHAVNATESDLRRLDKLVGLGRIPEVNNTAYIASMLEQVAPKHFPVKPFLVQPLHSGPGAEEVRIGILAVSPPAGNAVAEGKSLSAEAAIRRYLPEVDSQSDLVVLMTRMTPAELGETARKFPGIDVIINGSSTGEGKEYATVGTTVMVESAHTGIALGALQVEWDASGHIKNSQNQLIPIPSMMPESPKLAALVETAHREASAFEEAEARKSPPVSEPSVFAGAKACKDCHEKAYKAWERSAHAHAIDSLKREQNQYNRDCLPCHVLGFEMERGFVNVLRTPELASVQCESCHGTSTDHARSPMSKHPGVGAFQMSRYQVREGSCRRCHDDDRSPSFKFDKYWQKIEH